jgi:hypothetical protein
MSKRLPIPAARIAEVANAAHVCARTVQKYRDGLHVLDVVEMAVTAAIRGLPEDAQLQIPSVAGQQPPKRLLRVSPTMGQPGEVRSCPVGPDDCMSPTPTTPAGRSASKPKPLPRLKLELPDGVEAPEPDGRHWYEERTS